MRDLQADLGICNKATPGPWMYLKDIFNGSIYKKLSDGCRGHKLCELGTYGSVIFDRERYDDNAHFIAEAREGWPEAIERAIKAEEQAVALKEGLKRIKTNIEEYHPHNTLALPKFRFAKELHDIAIQALKELEVRP